MRRIWTNARLATLVPGTAGLGEIDRGLIAADADTGTCGKTVRL